MRKNTSIRVLLATMMLSGMLVLLLATSGCSLSGVLLKIASLGDTGTTSQQPDYPDSGQPNSQPDKSAVLQVIANSNEQNTSPQATTEDDPVDREAPGEAGVKVISEEGSTRLTTACYSVLIPDSEGPFDYMYLGGRPVEEATGDGSLATHQLVVILTGDNKTPYDCFYICCAEWPIWVDAPMAWSNTGIASHDGLSVVVGTPYNSDLSIAGFGWDVVSEDARKRLDSFVGYVQGLATPSAPSASA